MRVFLATTCIVVGSLLAAGCATKKYVRNTTAPIQAKVDQVGAQTTQNSQQIQETRVRPSRLTRRPRAASMPPRNGLQPRINTLLPPINMPAWPTSTQPMR